MSFNSDIVSLIVRKLQFGRGLVKTDVYGPGEYLQFAGYHLLVQMLLDQSVVQFLVCALKIVWRKSKNILDWF